MYEDIPEEALLDRYEEMIFSVGVTASDNCIGSRF